MTTENKRLKPNFMFSLPKLVGLARNAVMWGTRDLSELTTYGIDINFINTIDDKINEVTNFSTDDELLGAEMDRSETKVANFDDTKVGIRTMMVKVKQVFKEDSPTWILFGTRGLNEMNELQLIKCGFRVVRRATQFLNDLQAKGITQAMIDELQATVANFDEAYDKQQDAKFERKSFTVQRLIQANELYAMVSELMASGKDYWYTRNEAKYKNYIIYNTPSMKKPRGAGKGEGAAKGKKSKA